MKDVDVLSYYRNPETVDHYARAAAKLGLWRSEELVFASVFDQDDGLLEIGTGAGRIAIGLAELGYSRILGVDISREMIKRAQRLRQILEYAVAFQVMDARSLKFDDHAFDGAIFGFNGLMQIPGRDERLKALREIRRVVRPGGYFVFTTHDRRVGPYKRFWKEEARRWDEGKQDKALLEFGDKYEETESGRLYVHIPLPDEVRAALKETGWKCESDTLRSEITDEPPEIRAFSDECRFWVARNPETGEGA
ncbi:MAG: class I SAM-dependent methyltransferase [Opitutales bacterium]|nr:class I SAM-dependent methyltransferase [Opitutales bacterium]